MTGESAGREGLIRFVVDPEGRVVPDIAERLPGRGVWLTARRDIVETATRKGVFARGLKTRALADAAIADEIEALLTRRALDLIALARRAGEAVTGYEKTRAMLSAGRAGLLLHARDGSMDGLAKLGRTEGTTVVRVFDGVELGRPFGRDRAVHAALARGRLAESVERECRRLAGFRGQTGDVVVTMEGRQ